MKNYFKIGLFILAVSLYSCGGADDTNKDAAQSKTLMNPNNPNNPNKPTNSKETASTEKVEAPKGVDAIIDLENKGIGPVTSITIPEEIDMDLAAKGKKLYDAKCETCHLPHKRLVGPSQAGILKRRTAEWTMNMILNPAEMLQKDPLAKKLLEEYVAPMTDMGLTQEQARQVLEYIRTFDKEDLFSQLNK